MPKSAEEWAKDHLVEKISRVAYAAVREWCLITGQPVEGPWESLPDQYHDHLKITVAKAFADMVVPTPKELHEDCFKKAIDGGWRYGDKMDRQNRRHPDIVPWANLTFNQRMKEFILSSVIRAFLQGD